MSRSGYDDYYACDNPEWAMIRWRGAVNSAIKGKRGQKLLKEMLEALEAMEDKRLIAGELEADGMHCALGVVGAKRGIDMSFDPEDSERVAEVFDVAPALAKEIVFENDESIYYDITPEQRYRHMKRWVESNIQGETDEQV